MKLLTGSNLLVLNNKDYEIDKTIDLLANKSIQSIVEKLNAENIKIPRILNITALRHALNPLIKDALNLGLSDELLFRLRNYPYFNETQLQTLFAVLHDNIIYRNYREALMNLIILNIKYIFSRDDDFLSLFDVDDLNEDFFDYQTALNDCLVDFDYCFDGLALEDYNENFLKGVIADDLHQMNYKYRLNIPKRLKKEDLVEYIKTTMFERGLSESLYKDINTLSIVMLNRFAKKNNIKISADLKKDEYLNYCLYKASHLNLKYIKPTILDLYLEDDFVFSLDYVIKPVVVEQVTEETVEDVIPEPKVEEVKPEVVEVVKEEPITTPNNNYNISLEDFSKIITSSIKDTVKEVVKEIIPLVNLPKEESKQVEQVVPVLETKVETKEDTFYKFNNFEKQINPFYNDTLKNTIKSNDISQIDPNYNINDNTVLQEVKVDDISVQPIEVEENLDNLTEEERLNKKKELKEIKAQEKEASQLTKKEAKEEKKKAKKEAKEAQKLETKEAKEIRKQKEAEEKRALKIKAKEEKKLLKQKEIEAEILKKEKEQEEKRALKLKEQEEKLQAKQQLVKDKQMRKLNAKEEKKKAKQQAIIDKREAKEAEIRRMQELEAQAKANKKNYRELNKVLNGKGRIEDIDPEFFDKAMQLKNYKMLMNQEREKEELRSSEKRWRLFKILFFLIILIGLVYLGTALFASFNFKNSIYFYDYLQNNKILKPIFIPFVDWLKTFISFGG